MVQVSAELSRLVNLLHAILRFPLLLLWSLPLSFSIWPEPGEGVGKATSKPQEQLLYIGYNDWL